MLRDNESLVGDIQVHDDAISSSCMNVVAYAVNSVFVMSMSWDVSKYAYIFVLIHACGSRSVLLLLKCVHVCIYVCAYVMCA